jgi:hypothetical protein
MIPPAATKCADIPGFSSKMSCTTDELCGDTKRDK